MKYLIVLVISGGIAEVVRIPSLEEAISYIENYARGGFRLDRDEFSCFYLNEYGKYTRVYSYFPRVNYHGQQQESQLETK